MNSLPKLIVWNNKKSQQGRNHQCDLHLLILFKSQFCPSPFTEEHQLPNEEEEEEEEMESQQEKNHHSYAFKSWAEPLT